MSKRTLVALIFAVSGLPAAAADLEQVGSFVWAPEVANGVSGLEVSSDGGTFQAVTDLGWYIEGRFERTDGAISGLTVQKFLPILGQDGLPVAARRVGDWSDAEGLAIAVDGTMYISFERWAHVWRYRTPDRIADFIKDHPEFYGYADNRQLEAIAVDPGGRVFVFAERPERSSGKYPAYRLDESGWQVAGLIDERDGFSIVGADFHDDGRLYLLERKLVTGIWWQSRIRRFEVVEGAGEILWTSRLGQHTNLEGIAVWRGDDGLRVTLVSDNNLDDGEPTTFVEYRLTE